MRHTFLVALRRPSGLMPALLPRVVAMGGDVPASPMPVIEHPLALTGTYGDETAGP